MNIMAEITNNLNLFFVNIIAVKSSKILSYLILDECYGIEITKILS